MPSTVATDERGLLTVEFTAICLLAFVASCNVTVFYSLFNHLAALGIPPDLRGLVIGAYSLTALVLYLVASPFVTVRNAPRTLLLGVGLLAVCGVLYLVVRSFWGLLLLRVANGAGQFCMGAGAMVLLVSIIPPSRAGRAFGAYSVAFLAGYGAVPALADALAPVLPTPAHGYAAATLLLVPALPLIHRLRKATRGLAAAAHAQRVPTLADVRDDLAQPAVARLLLVNASYFVVWSSIFFLFKGFAQANGVGNVGAFLTVQTALMIVIRLGAGGLFDRFDKAWLIVLSFAAIAAGYVALDHLPGAWAVPLLGALFGLGMGAGYPAINGLMFERSPARFRALNANLMLFAVQLGFFLGPSLGGVLVVRAGYHGYFVASIALALASAWLGSTLALRRPAGRRAIG